MTQKTKYYTVAGVAVMLGKKPSTVRNWCDLQILPAKKDPGGRNWLIPADCIDKIIEEKTEKHLAR